MFFKESENISYKNLHVIRYLPCVCISFFRPNLSSVNLINYSCLVEKCGIRSSHDKFCSIFFCKFAKTLRGKLCVSTRNVKIAYLLHLEYFLLNIAFTNSKAKKSCKEISRWTSYRTANNPWSPPSFPWKHGLKYVMIIWFCTNN